MTSQCWTQDFSIAESWGRKWLPSKCTTSKNRLIKVLVFLFQVDLTFPAHFNLQDLASEDVMMLDSGDEVYIWIGSEATNEEKEKALQLAEVSKYSQLPKHLKWTNEVLFFLAGLHLHRPDWPWSDQHLDFQHQGGRGAQFLYLLVPLFLERWAFFKINKFLDWLNVKTQVEKWFYFLDL